MLIRVLFVTMKNLKSWFSFKKYFKRFLYLLKYFISFKCPQTLINKELE